MGVIGYKAPSRPPKLEYYWEKTNISVSIYDPNATYSLGDYIEHVNSEGKNILWELTWDGYVPSGLCDPDPDFFYAVGGDYDQCADYDPDDIVKYKSSWFKCLLNNGKYNDYIVHPMLDIWEEVVDDASKPITVFSTKATYAIGQRVSYDSKFYDALVDIRPEVGLSFYPDTTVLWKKANVDSYFIVTKDYNLSEINDLVLHNSVWYSLFDKVNLVVGETPNNNPLSWKIITYLPTYSRDDIYVRSSGEFEGYVIDNEEYFFVEEKNEEFVNPIKIENGKSQFVPSKDPRNRNIVNKMVHIALYCLHSSVVPDNIPTSRIANFEKSIEWLNDASDMKVNPKIDRRTFTVVTTNPVDGSTTEEELDSRRMVINRSTATRNTWEY